MASYMLYPKCARYSRECRLVPFSTVNTFGDTCVPVARRLLAENSSTTCYLAAQKRIGPQHSPAGQHSPRLQRPKPARPSQQTQPAHLKQISTSPDTEDLDQDSHNDEEEGELVQGDEAERLLFGTFNSQEQLRMTADVDVHRPSKEAQQQAILTTLQPLVLKGLDAQVVQAVAAAAQQGGIPSEPQALALQVQEMAQAAAGLRNLAKQLSVLAAGLGSPAVTPAAAVEAYLAATAAAIKLPAVLRLSESQIQAKLLDVQQVVGVTPGKAATLAAATPSLLLVPRDKLAVKLKALCNATGLPPEQAASMITLYMFPGIK